MTAINILAVLNKIVIKWYFSIKQEKGMHSVPQHSSWYKASLGKHQFRIPVLKENEQKNFFLLIFLLMLVLTDFQVNTSDTNKPV